MGIFDVTDGFCKDIKPQEYELKDQYQNGLKQHTQDIVTFTNNGENIIYREQM